METAGPSIASPRRRPDKNPVVTRDQVQYAKPIPISSSPPPTARPPDRGRLRRRRSIWDILAAARQGARHRLLTGGYGEDELERSGLPGFFQPGGSAEPHRRGRGAALRGLRYCVWL